MAKLCKNWDLYDKTLPCTNRAVDSRGECQTHIDHETAKKIVASKRAQDMLSRAEIAATNEIRRHLAEGRPVYGIKDGKRGWLNKVGATMVFELSYRQKIDINEAASYLAMCAREEECPWYVPRWLWRLL